MQLSDEAVQLRRVLDSIAEHPELREQRIAELRSPDADTRFAAVRALIAVERQPSCAA